MNENPFSKPITFKEIFSVFFVRSLFKAIWLFFPSILFVTFAWVAFWQLGQGKDLIQRTLENQRIFAIFIIAQFFWTYITWYSSDIVGKLKMNGLPISNPDKDTLYWGRMLTQMPRVMSFSCLTIMILAFFKLNSGEDLNWLFNLLFAASFFIYFIIYELWTGLAKKADTMPANDGIRYLKKINRSTLLILVVNLAIIFFFPSLTYLLALLIAFQAGLVLLLVFRKKIFYIQKSLEEPALVSDEADALMNDSNQKNSLTKIKEQMGVVKQIATDKEVKFYTRIFFIVFAIGSVFYFSSIFSIQVSTHIGAVPFILFAFGILLILGNGVTILSVIARLNMHILGFILAFVMGLIFEPHFTEIPEKKETTNFFNKRQTLTEYFKNWVEQRKTILDDSTNKNIYPVYFVLADGGASRSGYWSASVLASLDSQTNGKLTSHLFCLSGASGGSVGNAAYFNFIRAKQNNPSIRDADAVNIVQDYLETDFLTYTVARMLGPDVFRYVFPLKIIDDRAAALARVMETGAGNDCLLNNSVATCFSEIITQQNKPYSLPILCINTTRMQDGRPTVISNISLTDSRFNKRVDFLNLLGEDRDIKMSSAIVLGASFPYLSPAGRIDETLTGEKNYFVDGGYFDNSGSGVVSEMISILVQDSLYLKYKDRLQFYVLHATNSPYGDPVLGTVNPLVNDLAAPVKTIIGAYGTQTIVNDQRLKNQLKIQYKNDDHYIPLNLYDDDGKPTYPMDWVISDKALKAIKLRLYTNPEINKLAIDMKNKK